MTYTSFTQPKTLLFKLIERLSSSSSLLRSRYHIPQHLQDKEFTAKIQLRFASVLKNWMENFWQDFDHELTREVVNFVDNLSPDSESLVGAPIRKAILKRVCFSFFSF